MLVSGRVPGVCSFRGLEWNFRNEIGVPLKPGKTLRFFPQWVALFSIHIYDSGTAMNP